MSETAIPRSVRKSDEDLISGGAQTLEGGRLMLTDQQIEGIRKEHDNLEKAIEIISKMDEKTFFGFANELQFAMKYYDIGYGESQTSIFWNEGEHQSKEAMSAYSHFSDLRRAVIDSELYSAVRDGVRVRYGKKLPSDWTGWLGLDSTEDVQKISGALKTRFKESMPIVGLVGAGVTNKEVDEANKIIKNYGIEEVFVKDPNKGLVESFLHKWGNQK